MDSILCVAAYFGRKQFILYRYGDGLDPSLLAIAVHHPAVPSVRTATIAALQGEVISCLSKIPAISDQPSAPTTYSHSSLMAQHSRLALATVNHSGFKADYIGFHQPRIMHRPLYTDAREAKSQTYDQYCCLFTIVMTCESGIHLARTLQKAHNIIPWKRRTPWTSDSSYLPPTLSWPSLSSLF